MIIIEEGNSNQINKHVCYKMDLHNILCNIEDPDQPLRLCSVYQ